MEMNQGTQGKLLITELNYQLERGKGSRGCWKRIPTFVVGVESNMKI